MPDVDKYLWLLIKFSSLQMVAFVRWVVPWVLGTCVSVFLNVVISLSDKTANPIIWIG